MGKYKFKVEAPDCPSETEYEIQVSRKDFIAAVEVGLKEVAKELGSGYARDHPVYKQRLIDVVEELKLVSLNTKRVGFGSWWLKHVDEDLPACGCPLMQCGTTDQSVNLPEVPTAVFYSGYDGEMRRLTHYDAGIAVIKDEE